jgi:hypothetical protein
LLSFRTRPSSVWWKSFRTPTCGVPPMPRNLMSPPALITCAAMRCAWMNPEAIFAFSSSVQTRNAVFHSEPTSLPLLQCASVTWTETQTNPAHSCEASGLLGAPNANPCLCNTLSQISCTPCPGEGQRCRLGILAYILQTHQDLPVVPPLETYCSGRPFSAEILDHRQFLL